MKVCTIALSLLVSVILFGACSSPRVVCLGAGAHCLVAADCCSDDCNKGVCVGGGCTPAGVPCSASGQCCTEVCEGNGLCAACFPDGVACNSPNNCCSGNCNHGNCVQ